MNKAWLIVLLLAFSAAASPQMAFGYQHASIFDARAWVHKDGVDPMSGCVDSVMHMCREAKLLWSGVYPDSMSVSSFTIADIDDPEPTVSLMTWRVAVSGSSDLDIVSEGESLQPDGNFVAELYSRWIDREWAWTVYMEDPDYDNTLIQRTAEPGTVNVFYGIVFTPAGIEEFFSGLDDDALVTAMYCNSCGADDSWGLAEDGAYFCVDYDIYYWDGCNDIMRIMNALGCRRYPELAPNAGDADATLCNMELRGGVFADANQYSMHADCNNPYAAFDGTYAFDDRVVFRTASEVGSLLFFVMGVDSWADRDRRDWKSWDVLARVRPEGGPGVAHTYEVGGIPDKALYWVVEVDALGHPTFSPPFVRTDRPQHLDSLMAQSRAVSVNRQGSVGAAPELRALVDGRFEPIGGASSDTRVVGRPPAGDGVSARADSSACADILVCLPADYDSLAQPVVDHLSRYRRRNKVLWAFPDGSDLTCMRSVYGEVLTANVGYNAASATDRFPVNPGPLLLVVGDSWCVDGEVVSHLTFASTHGRCPFDDACRSDRDVTDPDGSGWRGLVHRIPGHTVEQITRACQGADDWNTGQYVDASQGVIQLVGNRLGDSAPEWPIDVALQAAGEFSEEGYVPKPMLVDGEFSPGYTYEKWDAFQLQWVEGARVIWGYGLGQPSSLGRWPGSFVCTPAALDDTVRQRTIGLFPYCQSVAVWSPWTQYPPDAPFVEQWMFNDLSGPQIVGVVGHLSGGWDHQHAKASELYAAAWEEAPPGVPLDWVVWRAAEMAEEQGLDWMRDYLRSAATMGAFVYAKPGDIECSIEAAPSTSLLLCTAACESSEADSVVLTVTARNLYDGLPQDGIPSGDIRVYGWSDEPNCFTFTCTDSCFGEPCLTNEMPTDADGKAEVCLRSGGGHDPAASVFAGINFADYGHTRFVGTHIEVKSPDYDADGDVSPVDFGVFCIDFLQGEGWRSDFDYDGDVDPVDYGVFVRHFGHDCGSGQTLPIPPELVAQLGLMPANESITELPSSYSLGQSSPNPSNPVTLIGYAVPPPGGRVTIEVLDVAGRRVTILVDVETDPGWYAVTWDGTADTGEKVASGVDFYRMEAPRFADRRKLVLLK